MKEINLTEEQVKAILGKQHLSYEQWEVVAIEEEGAKIAIIQPRGEADATSPTAKVVPLE